MGDGKSGGFAPKQMEEMQERLNTVTQLVKRVHKLESDWS